MHKRKSVLVNSSALVSLKLCIFFRLFPPFFVLFCSFISFFCLFYLFCPFYPFYILFRFFNSSLPFVILLYPYPHSFYSFPPFRILYSALFLNHLFLIFYSYKAFLRLYLSISFYLLSLLLFPCYLCVFPFIFPWSLCFIYSYSCLCVPFVVI